MLEELDQCVERRNKYVDDYNYIFSKIGNNVYKCNVTLTKKEQININD